MIKNLFALTALLILVGCATPPQGAADGSAPTLRKGRTMTLNGIVLTEVDAAAFPMGRFQGFPRIQRKADIVALDALSKQYAKAAWLAAGQKDWEGFVVNRRLGMRITEYRMHQKMVTNDFVDSLSTRGDGSGLLAPGATVFIPGFTRWGNTQKLAAVDLVPDLFAANVVPHYDWASAPKVADISGLLGTMTDVVTTAVRLSGSGQAGAQKQVNDQLALLPVGAVFSAHDAQGNSFLVERTPEGFNVGNPGKRPSAVPLGKLGFIPDMPMPNATRLAAAPLVMNMQEARHTLFWQAHTNSAGGLVTVNQPPNKVVVTGSRISGFLDSTGELTSDQSAITAGAAAYKSKPEFKLALEISNYGTHRDTSFEGQCYASDGKVYDTDFINATAEILRHKCMDNGKSVRRFVDYYVSDGKKMQTFTSLLADLDTAAKLKAADANRDLAESVIGFVPTIGNVDSAAKCLTGTAVSTWTAKTYDRLSGGNEAYRAFVSDLIPAPEDPSVLAKSLTCAAAVPMLGTATKTLAKAGKWVGVYRDWSAAEKAQGVFKALDFFDTSVFATAHPEQLGQISALSDRSMTTLKGFYDAMQISMGGTGLVNSSATVLQQ